MDDCLFCKIAAGQIPSNKLYEDDQLLAFYDIDPQAPTHFLVIPKQHIDSAAALTESDAALLGHIYAAVSYTHLDVYKRQVHLLGYLDQEGRGVTGLERAWDAVLANSCDQTAAVCRTTARGRLLGTGTPEIITEQQGTDAQVQLTLDADIQRLCEGLAQLYMSRGCILVMDTATGEVLASVSMPEYDPDDLSLIHI